jgi:hypothetical protein
MTTVRTLTRALLPIAAFAALAGAAHAQNVEVTLYEHENFEGASRTFFGRVDDLGRENFNDVASSVRVRGGTVRLCSDWRQGGRCVTLDRDTRSLFQAGLNDAVSSIDVVSGHQDGGWNRPQPGRGGLILHEGFGFGGRAISLDGATPNLVHLGFNDAARSLSLGRGEWLVCEDVNYAGRCEVVGRDVSDLSSLGLLARISSARPLSAGEGGGWNNGGGGWGGDWSGSASRPDAIGRTSAFFTRPMMGGRPVFAAGRSGGEFAADRFCRAAGFSEAGYFTTNGGGRRGEVLEDVLCVR